MAVLVDRVTPRGLSLQIVNLHPSSERNVTLKAGAFGEHAFTDVRHKRQTVPVGGKLLGVRLRPGAVGRLEIGMKRFVHRPSYAFPWHGDRAPAG